MYLSKEENQPYDENDILLCTTAEVTLITENDNKFEVRLESKYWVTEIVKRSLKV